MLFPFVIVQFDNSLSANFSLFRATMVGTWWWDVVCREWGFTDSAIHLIYRVNRVDGQSCGSVTGLVSFGQDFTVSQYVMTVRR